METEPAQPSSPEPRLQRSPLPVIFLTIFADLVSFSVIFPLFPRMLDFYLEKDGHSGFLGELVGLIEKIAGTDARDNLPALFGGVLGSVYGLLQFLATPFWGSLSDRVGRRPVLLVTIAGMAASYFLWFLSGNFTLLFVARCLGGIMSGNISVATAAVADVTTRQDRSKGMAIIGIAFGLGFILGPALGALLGEVNVTRAWPGGEAWGLNPFSAVAAAAFLLSICNWFWVWRRFKETLRPEDRGKAREEKRTNNPLRLLRPVNLPGVNAANLIWFLYLTAFSAMEFTLTFLAADRFAYRPEQNAYLFVFSGLVIVVVQGGLVRQLAPQYGEKALLLLGLATVIPGIALTGWAPREGALYLGLGLMAFGSAFVTPTTSALVSLYTPSDRQGSVLGIFRSIGSLARAAGPILGGLAYWHWGPTRAYLLSAAVVILPLVVAMTLPAPAKTE